MPYPHRTKVEKLSPLVKKPHEQIQKLDQLRLKRSLGNSYIINNLVGIGQHGRVYQGTHLPEERIIAIKIGFQQSPDTKLAKYQERLERCASLSHPNLIQILDIGHDSIDNAIVFAMEWVDGSNLDLAIETRQDSLTIGTLLGYFKKIAKGIDHVHSYDLIHRDIKPQNIFILPNDEIKISDFGTLLSKSETLSGAQTPTFGTPAFISPEQIIGTEVSPRTDIYSFGQTIYYLLTRCYAFDVKTPKDLLFAHMHQQPVSVRRRNEAWPSDLDNVFKIALAKNPKNRYSTATELYKSVQEALKSVTPLRISSFFAGTLSKSSGDTIPLPKL
jgi:eukaryotic-like serine/threonine-protein kinase